MALTQAVQGVVSSGLGAREGRSVRCADRVFDRKPSQRGEDPRRHLGKVVQLDVFVGDARLVLQAAHDRVVQVPLGREIAVDGALADPGAFGDGAEGQLVPVPGGEPAHQPSARVDDALASGGGGLLTRRAVVGRVVGPRGVDNSLIIASVY